MRKNNCSQRRDEILLCPMLCPKKFLGQKCLKDDAALGTDGLALVAGFSAGLLAGLAVLASGSGVLDLGRTTQVTKAAKSLTVGGGVERQVPCADSQTLREALGTTRADQVSVGGNKLWSGRDGGSKGQESDDNLHHGDWLVQASLWG